MYHMFAQKKREGRTIEGHREEGRKIHVLKLFKCNLFITEIKFSSKNFRRIRETDILNHSSNVKTLSFYFQ